MGCVNEIVCLLSISILACSHATMTNYYIDVTVLRNSTSIPSLFSEQPTQHIEIEYSVGKRREGDHYKKINNEIFCSGDTLLTSVQERNKWPSEHNLIIIFDYLKSGQKRVITRIILWNQTIRVIGHEVVDVKKKIQILFSQNC